MSISRRKLAKYASERIIKGENLRKLQKELAAYLISEGKIREVELLTADIESELEKNGIIIADVSSARELSDKTRKMIQKKLGGKKVYLREKIDENLIGGVKIEFAGKQVDETILHKLNLLKAESKGFYYWE